MAGHTKQRPPSYVDFMNDVFDTPPLPNMCNSDVISHHPERSFSNSSKSDVYKEKWIQAKNALNDKVIVRVNGVDFGLNWKVLAKLEPALESGDFDVWQHIDHGTKIYCVNRNVQCFEAIVDYCRYGDLHMPIDVCPNVFKREMDFWKVDFRKMTQCCLRRYANFLENEQTLSEFSAAYLVKPVSKSPLASPATMSRWRRTQMTGWAILSDPSSSVWAKVYLGVASFFVVLSIFLLFASTNTTFLRQLTEDEWEEYMTSAELDYFYELVYKRPKSSELQGGGWSNDGPDDSSGSSWEDFEDPTTPAFTGGTTGTTDATQTTTSGGSGGGGGGGHSVGKRSAPDKNMKPLTENDKQPAQAFDPRRRAVEVEKLPNLKKLSENFDVSDEISKLDDFEDFDDDQALYRMNLNDLVKEILLEVRRQNPPKARADGRKHTTDVRRRQRSRNEKVETRVLRHRRSTQTNESVSSNNTEESLNHTSGEGCIFMSKEDLQDAVREIAHQTAAIIASENSPQLPTAYTVYNWGNYLDLMCFAFFALEFIIRFIFAPSKVRHLLSFFTIIDFLALVTMLTTQLIDVLNPKEKYTTSVVDAINCFQVVRVFRFFRLMKDVVGFQVLMFSIKSSWRELLLLVLYIVMAVTIFSTLIYFSEKENMRSIPDACWWAIVTMTTVGYGDMAPTTIWGKLIGVGCALSGVLLIAVTVPVFVNNFLLFYEHSKVGQYENKRAEEDQQEQLQQQQQQQKQQAMNATKCSWSSQQTDSISELSDTTSAGDSLDKVSVGKESITRPGSGVDLVSSKPRLRSEVSMSKVTPIFIKESTNA